MLVHTKINYWLALSWREKDYGVLLLSTTKPATLVLRRTFVAMLSLLTDDTFCDVITECFMTLFTTDFEQTGKFT